MVLITENGWPQCTRAQCETLLVPGTENNPVRIELLAGDVAVVLTAWASWFHRNVRPINTYRDRDWWGWSRTNDVWNSNHLSATAEDLIATQLPWKKYTLAPSEVDTVHRGIALFEGTVFWGRDWGIGQQDEMHFQIGYNMVNNPKLKEFADRLRNGYLNIFGPPDPLAFPLPVGYYYGPLDGPAESISGEYQTDSQYAKDGLGRWQAALGIPVTKKWNDGVTPKAATTLQKAKGWPPNPLFGYGGVYLGEWDAVIREGWRLPQGWSPNDPSIPDPEPTTVLWGDYSQYQSAFLNDSYPYQVVCFRASVGDSTRNDPGSSTGKAGLDNKFVENMARAKAMVRAGKLKKVIAYHFWVPGTDNFGTFKDAIERTGGVFSELALMIDVEDGGTKWNVKGDQSVGVNDFVVKCQEYLQNKQGVIGYLNFRANANLWLNIPDGLKMIVPDYSSDNPYYRPGTNFFAQQFSSTFNTPPFGPSDINKAKMPLSQFLLAFGTNGSGVVIPPVDPPDTKRTRRDLILAQFV